MLSIRMQRTGRKGHAMFRMVVQQSHLAPTSGKVVARLGSYDPHAKTVTVDKDKAAEFLKNGAQPTDRVVYLLTKEGLKMPAWVKTTGQKSRATRNPDKLRKNQPADAPVEAAADDVATETPADETAAPETESESQAETGDEAPAEAKEA